MWMTINVKLKERVVLYRDNLPVRALGPGKYRVWKSGVALRSWATDTLVFESTPESRALMPASWFNELRVEPNQRAVLLRDGKPQVFLRPGVHRYWTVDPAVEARVFSVDEAMPALSDEWRAVIAASEYAECTIREFERGIEYINGRLSRVLEPGYYARWSRPEAKVNYQVIDMRGQLLTVSGQELMTRDKVTLRLTLNIDYAVTDPIKATHAVADLREALYALVQLAARDYVGSVTLDELLEGREKMTHYLEQVTVTKAAALGVRLERVGVKDVVLPGEMKTLLNRVIEAEKQAAANVILRREEAAATRHMANTARVMTDLPVLVRLKELDALKEIAERIDEVRVVVGADGLEGLLQTQRLNSPKA